MDTNSLLCLIEVIGTLLIAGLAAVIGFWSKNKRDLEQMGETTRANRPQWLSILAAFLGANLGYLLFAGGYFLATRMSAPAFTESFLIPASLVTYFMCAIPIYLPFAAITGLLVHRFTRSRDLSLRAGFLLSLLVSLVIGFVLGIPIFFLSLMAAAV